MSDKYEVAVVLFLEITANQYFLLRLQIEWVANLAVVLFGYQLLGFIEAYLRDLAEGRCPAWTVPFCNPSLTAPWYILRSRSPWP